MTLPKANKFPSLPGGYRFELEHDGVSYTHRENQYHIWVVPIDYDEDEDGSLDVLASEQRVIESYVLDAARRLAELARLEVDERDGDTKIRVGGLNHELRIRAEKSHK